MLRLLWRLGDCEGCWGREANGNRFSLLVKPQKALPDLQIARRELGLESAIAKLDKYRLLILDDIAYVSKDQAETSVLAIILSGRPPLTAVFVWRTRVLKQKLQWQIDVVSSQLREIAWLASIVECSDDAIVSKSLEGIITSWNKPPSGSSAICLKRPSANQ